MRSSQVPTSDTRFGGANNHKKPKPSDLGERTYEFARDVRAFVNLLPRTICNIEDVKQVVRSSESVGANDIEANDALSRKDSRHRLRITRKEARESVYWLRLLDTGTLATLHQNRAELIQEANELVKIFGHLAETDRAATPHRVV